MAILQPNTNSSKSRIKSGDLPPKGRYIATCIENEDQLGVERTKYQSTEVERVNLTTFYFGFTDKNGKSWAVRSKEMKAVIAEKATLVQFLRSWTGSTPTKGFDTASLIGQGAEIRIEHVESDRTPGRFFAKISDIAPVDDEDAGKVKPALQYASLLTPRAGESVDSDDEMPF